jgi:hypothetical protein
MHWRGKADSERNLIDQKRVYLLLHRTGISLCVKQKTVQSIQAEERGFSSVDQKRFYLLLNRAIFRRFFPRFPHPILRR